MQEHKRIAVVGNPNCGKTSLFNALTGGKQRVGNWPGVTVEKKSGEYRHDGQKIEVIDLPGIYSLSSSSLDEQIARDYIVNENPDVIVNILDAANLERNLYLTVQLIEMKVPLVVVLNMMDMAKQKKIKIKIDQLARALDCPLVCTVANKSQGIESFKTAVNTMLDHRAVSCANVYFQDEVETEIKKVAAFLDNHMGDICHDDSRWVAIKLLENDYRKCMVAHASNLEFKKLLAESHQVIRTILGEEADVMIAEGRYGFINAVCKKVVDRTNIVRANVSHVIDSIVLNRVMGMPIFFLAMYLTFWITVNVGGAFIDFFDQLAGTFFVDGLGVVMERIGIPIFFKTFFADGLGAGVQTVATFIPPIFFMFFCLSILEDSGYMARAAFIMDRLMRWIGLPGKAFVPMLVGFGCNVPAIMATRTLEDEKDRIMTILMNPFMSCGARMPVYALFAAMFFPNSGSLVVFSLYVTGIVLALATALVLKRTILSGEASPFIMELPPYHIPTLKAVVIHTWGRLKSFMVRAGKAIIIVVVILTFLNSIGTDGSFGNENSENSVLSAIGKTITPVFMPMGMREDNWPAAVGIFTGIFAKESVIATLDSLYTQIDGLAEESAVEEEPFHFGGSIADAFATIPASLRQITLPFSFVDLIGADVDGAIDELAVQEKTYSSYHKRFDGKTGAYAYLLMILLYMPCVAAVAAVYKEIGLGWTIFSCTYLSGLAWICATCFYQIARFGAHPGSSFSWIAFCAILCVAFYFGLRAKGRPQVM